MSVARCPLAAAAVLSLLAAPVACFSGAIRLVDELVEEEPLVQSAEPFCLVDRWSPMICLVEPVPC